ncbi:hypothetical protein PLEOSDRAFT_172987 [Pleurotus ostreatus PC15]|uniref:TPR-like protein n=1 Tax=Pleurotus ostreatus (strain PC15) TaxID=1137138 RepID=A0A067NUB4_PLEO1|nr:hypothetical protein PLEOSDRAFT_172987 [Pleurotus ostreatus PC15]
MAESELPPPEATNSQPQDDDLVPGNENSPTEDLLDIAEQLKVKGNDHFRTAEWGAALSMYQEALDKLPKRKVQKPDDPTPEPFEDDLEGHPTAPFTSTPSPPPSEGIGPSEFDITCAKLRSVLNANIGACHVKLRSYKEAADACTQAILDDPEYVKALQRRAAANEQLNTWSSLSSAQEGEPWVFFVLCLLPTPVDLDYKKLLTLLPQGSSQGRDVERSLRAIGPRVEAAQKAETAEMLGKLKGLGNSILGNFGLSTDNFKFEPNGQGGYSMQFSQ